MERPTSTPSEPSSASANATADDLPRLLRWLQPAVDAVARIRMSVHNKLLIGFLFVALLLVGMAALSLVVINRMNERMDAYDREAQKVDLAQQMLYDVTAQSHYRAMALLEWDPGDPSVAAGWNDKVTQRKRHVAMLLSDLRDLDPDDASFYDDLSSANQKYAADSRLVVEAFQAGHRDEAERLHLGLEHRASHVLEDMLSTCGKPATAITAATHPCGTLGVPFIQHAQDGMIQARADFASDRSLLQKNVLAFSAASIAAALLLGFLFSWAFVVPVRRVHHALARLASGHFDERVEVPNRDEFGSLTRDLDATSEQLQTLFAHERHLAAELRETNASLARASEAKTNFLASVSHELRTPMNAVLGFTEALLAGVDGPLNDDQKTSLGWVQRGGNHLLSLINELLDLSRIEAGRLTLTPKPFHPVEMVEAAIAEHRPLADPKNLGLSYRDLGAPAEVVQDPQRVRQILDNLLGNAVKLTDQGEVEVIVSDADNGLRIAVRDSGPGIPDHERDAIFEEFHQAHGSHHGTGLGLSISRRLARAMGGDISVQSEVGRGSTFVLWVPSNFPTPRTAPARSTVDHTAGEASLENPEVP